MKLSSEDGFALISVFWALILLSLLAMTALSLGKSSRKITRANYSYSKADYIAEAGINYTLYNLSQRNAPQIIPDRVYEYSYSFAGQKVDIEIVPTEGLIDLNTSDPKLISALLAYFKISDALATAIANRVAEKRDSDVENKFYFIDDIKSIKDFPVDLFECIKPFLTVYSQHIGVDLSVASPQMKNLVKWADSVRWGGESWFNTDGTSIGSHVSGLNSKGNTKSYSGKAFRIIATVHIGDNIKLRKKGVYRITGNAREPYWVYMNRSSYEVDMDHQCTHY